MTQQLSAEAIKQAGIALHRVAEGLKAVGDALIVLGGESAVVVNAPTFGARPTNAQGGAADPPKVAAEAAVRGPGRPRKAPPDASPPPPAAAVPAAAPPPPAAALDYERDVKPLVVQMFGTQTKTLGKAEAVEFGKAFLQRYGADTFAPNGRPGLKPLDPSQYAKAVDEIRRILAGEDTGVLGGTDDNSLGL